MTVRRAARTALALLLPVTAALAACSPGGTGAGTAAGAESSDVGSELTVLAAASLVDVAEQVSAAVEAEHPGLAVSLSLGGSSDLVSQVVAGAPADVLVTADETTMGRAVTEGVVEAPVVVALNHPVLVVPAGNPAGVTGLDDSLADAVLVVCAPQVPCGAAAAQLADRAGVTLAPASEEPNVTDTLGKVTSGQADAGIVYATDARRAGDAVETVPVPGAEQVINRYPAAVVAGTAHPTAARAWVGTLTGDEGRRILADAGFTLP